MTDLNLVTVVLMDQDTKIPANMRNQLSVIAKYEDVVVEAGENEQMTILKLAVNEDIKGVLELHNKQRGKIVNSVTLERTGVEVFLPPITIEQVTIKMK